MLTDKLLLPTFDYSDIKKRFLQDLHSATNGQNSSLTFLKYRFPQQPLITQDEDRIVQAIVIGGTNYEVALVHMDHGTANVLERKKGSLPQLATLSDFENIMHEFFNEKATALALNFAWPLEQTTGSAGELDGVLVSGGKTHQLDGLVGKPVGEAVKNMFQRKFNKTIPVTAVNDVVCLIQGDGAIIVATGTNIGLHLLENGQEIDIDVESGSFSNFDPPEEIEALDTLFNNPGRARFEKLVSGKYLPARYNILSELHKLDVPKVGKCEELDHLAMDNKSVAGELARALLEQSASLVAAQLAAIYEFKNRPDKMIFSAEGSVIRKAWKYEENMKKQLVLLGVPDGSIMLIHPYDSSIQGAISLLTRHN